MAYTEEEKKALTDWQGGLRDELKEIDKFIKEYESLETIITKIKFMNDMGNSLDERNAKEYFQCKLDLELQNKEEELNESRKLIKIYETVIDAIQKI